MNRHFNLTLAAITAISLVGCGGGGGGSSSSTTPTQPTGPTVPPMTQAALQTATTPTYAAGSEELNFFNAVNTFRTAQGMGPLIQNAYYDSAAAAHANYTDLNGLSHSETPGLQGYTGANPLARVQYQGGVATLVEEEAGQADFQGPVLTGQGTSFANVLINTVYHRAGLMFQGLTTVGTSIGVSETKPFSIAELGYNVNQQVNAGNYFGVYPANGQTGVSLSPHAESPSPIPAGASTSSYGSPISVASQESTTLTISSFTVTPQGSTTLLPTITITGSDPNLAGNNNLAFLLPTVAYQPNTTYTVQFTGTITGTATGSATGLPISQSWSFTTGTTSN